MKKQNILFKVKDLWRDSKGRVLVSSPMMDQKFVVILHAGVCSSEAEMAIG